MCIRENTTQIITFLIVYSSKIFISKSFNIHFSVKLQRVFALKCVYPHLLFLGVQSIASECWYWVPMPSVSLGSPQGRSNRDPQGGGKYA